MRKANWVVILCICVMASGVALAQGNLLKDGDCSGYTMDKPGPWEVRFGHKGDAKKEPEAVPLWQVKSAKDASGDHGSYLDVTKSDKKGSGMVLIGQRVTLPQDVSGLTLSVDYQAFCKVKDRSGMVGLGVYKPQSWDKLPKTPEEAKRGVNRGDIYNELVKKQGDDQTEWAAASLDSKKLGAKLAPYAGKEVVVVVSFLTWHQGSEEWAKFDNLRLAPGK